MPASRLQDRAMGRGLGHAKQAGQALLALPKGVGVGGGGQGPQRCFGSDPAEMLSRDAGSHVKNGEAKPALWQRQMAGLQALWIH